MSFEISKENLYDLYINKNLTAYEIADKFDVSEQVVRKKIKKYEIKKDKELLYKKIKEIVSQKYGVKNISQLDSVKKKKENKSIQKYGVKNISQSEIIKDKKRKKSLEKYGTNSVLQAKENKEKIRQTNMKKYGVPNAMENKEIQEKARQTCAKKYGTEYPQKLDSVKKKQKQTVLEKYGVENVMQVQYIKDKLKKSMIKKYGIENNLEREDIKRKIKETCLKKYGVPYACMREECRNANKGSISKINQQISELLTKNDIKNKLEFNLENYSYDIQILDTNILLEINPTYTHNSTYGSEFRNHKKKELDKNYHQNKSIIAKNNGYRCIHIWDWDNIDKIIKMLKSKKHIYARECEIFEVSEEECNNFLNENHLQGTCKGQQIRLGLYWLGKLVEVITFGKPRYNKNYEYELLRLCSCNDYLIVGGTEKLFKYFLDKYNPKSIISYCDNSKFDGNVYIKLNFELKSYGKPSKHWYNIKNKQHITDNLLRQRGFDQLFKTNYGKGTSNKNLMIENGFVEVFDAGQSTYTYKKE